jgi:hypothetical protein
VSGHERVDWNQIENDAVSAIYLAHIRLAALAANGRCSEKLARRADELQHKVRRELGRLAADEARFGE